MKMRVFSAVAMALVFAVGEMVGDTIVGWRVHNVPGSLPPTVAAPNVVAVPLSRGPGISYSSWPADDPYVYRSRYFSTEGRDERDYLEWGFSSAIPWDLEKVQIKVKGDEHICDIYASFDGGDFYKILDGPWVYGTATLSVDLSSLPEVNSARFRLYAFGADRSHANFDVINDLGGAPPDERAIRVLGVPEPATLSLLAVGAVALIRRRRK